MNARSALAQLLILGSILASIAPALAAAPPSGEDGAAATADAEEAAPTPLAPEPAADAEEEEGGAIASVRSWLGEEAFEIVWRVGLAIVLFIAGWLLARFLSWVVFRLLRKTDLDDRLAEKLGLKMLMEDQEDPDRLERITARVVFWILMMFVLVAVLQFAGLTQVAVPIQSLVNSIVGALPNIGKAVLILTVAFLAALVLKKLVTAGLDKLGVDSRLAEMGEPDDSGKVVEQRPFSQTAGQVIFWLIMILGLAGALDALQISTLSDPLRNMLDQVVGFLPGLAVAALVLVAGYVLGRIARVVVTNLLESVGLERGVERIKIQRLFGETGASKVMGIIVFWFVMLQAIIAGLDRLGLETISAPLTNVMERFWNILPDIGLAVLFVTAAWFVAKLVRAGVERLLDNLGFDNLMARLGFEKVADRQRVGRPSVIVGQLVQVGILLIAVPQALTNLGLTTWATYVDTFLNYALNNVLVAALIVLAGMVLANWAHDIIASRQDEERTGRWISALVRYTILVFAFTMALYQLDIAQEIVIITFALLFGALCLAFGLAFGLGSRDVASEIVRERYDDARGGPAPKGDTPTPEE